MTTAPIRSIAINVYNSHEDEGFLPTTLLELQTVIDTCLSRIPLQKINTTYVDIVQSNNPRIGITMQIGYCREETPEEALKRQETERDNLRREIEAKSIQLRELCLRYPAL